VIKWSEFSEGDSLYEAFLPEHDRESSAWLLRWSRNGHIIKELRVRLTWPPRFGPDAGDVAQIEAALDKLMTDSTAQSPPATRGEYVTAPFVPLPSTPELLAALAVRVAEYVDAEHALGLNEEETRRYLGLPVGAKVDGLYPMAVTPERDRRMLRLITLAGLLERDGRAAPRRTELIAAVLAEDVPAIGRILEAQGIRVDAEIPSRVDPP
jgi:hypothetical protein